MITSVTRNNWTGYRNMQYVEGEEENRKNNIR